MNMTENRKYPKTAIINGQTMVWSEETGQYLKISDKPTLPTEEEIQNFLRRIEMWKQGEIPF